MSTLILPDTGPLIATERDATDVIGQALGQEADLVVIPIVRLAPDFFRLSSGLAGAVLQKFTNYRLRVAIVGDVSAHTSQSASLRDFIRESNRRGDIRFVDSVAAL